MTRPSNSTSGAGSAARGRSEPAANSGPAALWSFGGGLSPLAMMEAGKPPSTPLEAWISLFPASPLFGVRWVMWDMMRMGAGAGVGLGGGGAQSTRSSAAREAEVLSMPDARRLPPRQPTVEISAPTPDFGATEPVAPVAPTPPAPPVESTFEPAVEPAVEPVPAAAPTPVRPSNLLTAPPARIDDLKMIKGVGPRLETRLNELGIYLFSQIADFGEADFAWLDDHLAALFRGRAVRDGWAEQAKALRDAQN